MERGGEDNRAKVCLLRGTYLAGGASAGVAVAGAGASVAVASRITSISETGRESGR